MGVWEFIQDQILRMEWLDVAIGSLLSFIGIDTGTRLGGSLQFLVYDLIKILILLTVLIFLISYIQSYFPPERTKRILGKYRGLRGNTIGALLGTVTPFCSCSSIPIFVGLTRSGLPMGIAFSFLISSPFVDLAALILLTGVFGIELAVIYVVMGVLLAIIGGTLIDRLHMEDQIMDFVKPAVSDEVPVSSCCCSCRKRDPETHRERASYSMGQVRDTLRKVWVYILIGVSIGALIHNWIPEEFVIRLLGSGNPFGVILATIAGVPMYADIFGTIPIAEALLAKGAQLGVVLSFMMGVTTLSLPSMIMLRKAVKPKLLGIFIAICTIGIIIVGYFFNAIAPAII